VISSSSSVTRSNAKTRSESNVRRELQVPAATPRICRLLRALCAGGGSAHRI
jgi:hypothetical protein